MKSKHFSTRHFLKKKQLKKINESISRYYNYDFSLTSNPVERAISRDWDILILDREPAFFLVEGDFYLTLKGHERYRLTSKFVTVDMGAVPYLVNGADVMAPGIIDADPSIRKGDIVWVRDERNLKPISIGRSRVSGDDLVSSTKGKVVETIHFVGDFLWNAEL